jgi:hypothetical protein
VLARKTPSVVLPRNMRAVADCAISRAIYQFVKSLGPAGVPAPNAVEPWREPSTPVVDMRALPTPHP